MIFRGSGPVWPRNPLDLWFFRGVWTPGHIGSYTRLQPKLCSPPNSIQSSAQMGRALGIGNLGLSIPYTYIYTYIRTFCMRAADAISTEILRTGPYISKGHNLNIKGYKGCRPLIHADSHAVYLATTALCKTWMD